mmetsp:Transcript_16996/g.25726  ORF Transcript_16996/g.25726 Transcript_16996/m.25726 type:complete len:413 (-) Transcript_16996:1013-2251(-)|eukprot:CAMPEP_0178908252 /NCGR_PEP_ID=MMETSP0786-20121207/7819_1 /TAXON_ID=186022 /ORGANISM="Thalassionema frauenfeldii, Strain CCMP 1798" /LENGTH=412 /DNA_ID=CAMNT_0020580133 /DNA_START=28 /DNA_END=1266 /DNA_ORIENTATION=+
MVRFTKLAFSLFSFQQDGGNYLSIRKRTRNYYPAAVTTTIVKSSSTIINELLENGRRVSLETKNVIRGVYLKEDVREGDMILSVPLEFCLCDDSPPKWFPEPKQQEENDDELSYIKVQDWVTRLTAGLVDLRLQLTNESNKVSPLQKAWLDLLPTDLNQILPIHWDDPSILTSTNCRPLELAVDSAYFAREHIIETLRAARPDIPRLELETCLDLVQTRACRIEQRNEDNETMPLRVLGPMFDMINHDRNPNAEFIRGDNNTLVVRALRTIPKKSQVLISYGVSSTQPAWRCLFSYGFVPEITDIYEDDAAELVVDGMRFEINPTEIPFELIQLEAQRDNVQDNVEDEVLTPTIGNRIVQNLREAAEDLRQKNEEETKTIAHQLAANLRESNRRTLLACAGGLEEYIQDNLG